MAHLSMCNVCLVERFDFPKEEERILAYWESIDAFTVSLELSANRPLFNFYDGPPFATGLPHYGHILAGTIKDTILRYASQKGFHVPRRFGWDCHGLPIEHEIDKKLGITSKDDIMKMGISAYNKECRGIVTRYVTEWEAIVKRAGRWIDFKNDFKTMYPTSMESVWWVFKSLFDMGKVYEGYKVMPYSTACTSPISNFEANLNYKDTQDPSILVSFPLVHEPDTSLLIWTTTPWTLPSNLAIVAHPEFNYLKIKDIESGCHYIVLDKRLDCLYKSPVEGDNYIVVGNYKGSDMKGWAYEPVFKFFEDRKARNNFVVVVDSYVTDDTGTGLVHCAPGFGEDDQRIGIANGIVTSDECSICPVDVSGKLTDPIADFKGMYFKDADKEIIKAIKSMNRLVRQATIVHSYPFCWRSDTPLMYRAVPSWFVRVAESTEALLRCNDQTYWVPEHVKRKKFANWLENARDWAVSRNRYWGTPIPIWASPDHDEVVCVGSIAELEELTGSSGITDIHREFIDGLVIPSKIPGNPPLKRVDGVFDCWFESGCVPYSLNHYPFENRDLFDVSFPADFIAEGIDQTRGWFYTLMVLSTLLFDRPAFKNVIVNGLVLASDGKKMSKRLKNYPEPTLVMDSYGADAMRLYLINSPVVAADFLKFSEPGVKNILRDVFLPWVNCHKFFSEQISLFSKETGSSFSVSGDTMTSFCPKNVMDCWILSALQTLVTYVRREMDAYHLYAVVPHLLAFIEQLTNWYVRLNRPRLKGQTAAENLEGTDVVQDRQESLTTLYIVLFTVSKLMAPFTPFLAENMYLKLKVFLNDTTTPDREQLSVHFLPYPSPVSRLINLAIERAVGKLQNVIEGGRTLRESKNISLKTPLADIVVILPSTEMLADLTPLVSYIKQELNVREVKLTTDEQEFGVSYKATPNFSLLGKKYRTDLGKLQVALKGVTSEALKAFLQSEEHKLLPLMGANGQVAFELTAEEVNVNRVLESAPEGYMLLSNPSTLILLNGVRDEKLEAEGLARELVNRVQKLRKKANLKATDLDVRTFYTLEHDHTKGKLFKFMLATQQELFVKVLKSMITEEPTFLEKDDVLEREQCLLLGNDVKVILTLAKLHAAP